MTGCWSAILFPFLLEVFWSFLRQPWLEEQNHFSPVRSVWDIWHQLFLPTCWSELFSSGGSILYEWSSISKLCQASLERTEGHVLWSQLCWSAPAHWSASVNIKRKHVIVCYWRRHEHIKVEGGRNEKVQQSCVLVRHAASLLGPGASVVGVWADAAMEKQIIELTV